MDTWLQNRKLSLRRLPLIGKGGEAEVYDLGDGTALKLFKQPSHADFAAFPEQLQAAQERLAQHQRKLPAFPPGLPEEVMAPLALARSGRTSGEIVGYSMPLVSDAEPLLRWSEPVFRRSGATSQQAAALFVELRRLVSSLHSRGVVIGDFNDLNVLVRKSASGAPAPVLIDTDSFQFGGFNCAVFTERFVDPRLCDPRSPSPVLTRPYDVSADWFAFAALLTQSLLLLGPWSGIHRPRDPKLVIQGPRRAQQRHSIFRGDVQLPKVARPLDSLPDDLLHELTSIFDRDERRPMPEPMLATLRFSTCASCGLEFARNACPICRPHAAAPARRVAQSRGRLLVTTLHDSAGTLLRCATDGSTPRWLEHRDGAFSREHGPIANGLLDPRTLHVLSGDSTAFALGARVTLVSPRAAPRTFSCDLVDGRPALAANSSHLVWSDQGRLLSLDTSAAALRSALTEPSLVGEILPRETRIALGDRFGLALTRLGSSTLVSAFVPGRRGLEEHTLPPLPGHVLSVRQAFSPTRALVAIALRDQGHTRHHLISFDQHAQVLARSEADEGDGSWLGELPALCIAGELLFAGTEDGLVRLDDRAGTLAGARGFAETEGLVDPSSELWPHAGGLLVHTGNSLRHLRFS
ncbi:MAG: hypothetical protein JST92_11855 [Deltaproteobacteria bacterium]|nr:hypothetical protein [Deltaproteobacteria bacterium]